MPVSLTIHTTQQLQGVIAIPTSSSATEVPFASTTLKFAMATMTVAASTTLTKTTAVYRHLYFIANVI